MKKIILILCLLSQPTISQYTFKCPYLQQPELVFGYVDSCAQFWKKVYDTTYGGFYTNVGRSGNVMTSSGTNKNMISQSRDAYGMTRAFMLTGKDEYLTYAKNALDFMYRSAWDKTYGGWMDAVDKYGNPTQSSAAKSAFNQHYALLGITAYYEATGNTSAWNWLMRGYEYNETKLWDSRPDFFGYYDQINAAGTTPSGKSFNATVDAITTHVLHLYLLTGDTTYLVRLKQLCSNMKDRLVASAPQQAIGFVEVYNSDWSWNTGETMTIMGHVLKTAWCFGRVYQLYPDTSYLSAAKFLLNDVLAKGYDHQYGGPYKDYNRVTGAMLMWGQKDTAKAWWQMEQAIVAGLMLYPLTGDLEYLVMADETADFFMKYFVDHTYGEVYENRTKVGGLIWNENKGGSGKAGYHSIETGYYMYLYTKLLVKKEPAILYYSFPSSNKEHFVQLSPLSLPPGQLKIKEVRLNDTVFSTFNRDTRSLRIPPGAGGKFAVTFETAGANSIAMEKNNTKPEVFALNQNYPNPFNPTTSISFDVPAQSRVSIKIYDVMGREISTVADGWYDAGIHTVQWNAGSYTSGVYFYVMKTGNQTLSRKMVLLR